VDLASVGRDMFEKGPFEDLVGKLIKGIYINKSSLDVLEFETDAGPMLYVAEGDCCSESWFADVDCDNLIGGTVTSVKEIDGLPNELVDCFTRQEVDRVYGYKIKTDIGEGDIIFRNSSNGYYGGWCQKWEDSKYNRNDDNMISIKDLTEGILYRNV